MDANINVAKIFSFRSDNSPRWAFRVDGTESGSNAGADFAIRRYTDLGAFIDTPLTITRSTGASTFGGNVGIGATLSSWISTAKVLQLNNTAALYAPTDESILSNNVFVDSGDNNKYITSNFASQYRQVNGQHLFYSAASGTLGNTISFGSPKFTITSVGTVNIGISTTSTYGRLVMNAGTNQNIWVRSSGGIACFEATNDAVDANVPMRFAATEYSFASGGNVLVGSSTDNGNRLQVNGNVNIGKLFSNFSGSVYINNSTISTIIDLSAIMSNHDSAIISIGQTDSNKLAKATVIVQRSAYTSGITYSVATLGTQPIAAYLTFSISGANLQMQTTGGAATFAYNAIILPAY
jgi:hypothetical protein